MGFSSLTVEEKKIIRQKAQIAKTAAYEARKASTLRRDFLDSDTWEELARERGLRLPPWGQAATLSNMRTWIHKIGWSQREAEQWAGCKLVELIEHNSTWPARALAGAMLEGVCDQRSTDL